MPRTLTHDEAKSFYDRFGRRQDWQGFYEDPAVRDLLGHADFGSAGAVLEFGCGTGRLARWLLADHLPPEARYVGLDISDTMVAIAGPRLAPWGARAEVRLSDGTMTLPFEAGAFDRVLATYVLDVLSEGDIRALLAEAHRVLGAGGKLCTTCLTPGTTPLSRLVTGVWRRLHAARPALVGGCRPIAIVDYLPPAEWTVEHRRVVTTLGIASEVVVARRR